MTANIKRDVTYAGKDDKLTGDVETGEKTLITTESGDTYEGDLLHLSPVMSHSGWFHQHAIAVEVEDIGSVWVHTAREDGDAVMVDAPDAENPYGDNLGKLEEVEIIVEDVDVDDTDATDGHECDECGEEKSSVETYPGRPTWGGPGAPRDICDACLEELQQKNADRMNTMTQEPTKATREAMESLSVGDEVTINRTGKHMNGGTYTITEVEDDRSYKVTDEKGREGMLVRTYEGQNRVHIENGPRRNFTWIVVE